MSLEFSLVPHGHITAVLPSMIEFLKKSELWTKGRAGIDDIVGFLYSGQMQLWVVYDPEASTTHGYVISEIKRYPRATVLVVQYLAGEKHVMATVDQKVHGTLDRYARDAGCSIIEGFGRPGWGKHLEKFGYTVQTVLYEKYLEKRNE